MPNQIWKAIEDGSIASVYLVVGIERYIFEETVKRLTKAVLGEEQGELYRFDLNETPVTEVLEEADTLPIFSSHKLIVANNATFLKATDQSKEKVKHQVSVLESWIDRPSPTATVLFYAPYEKVDKRKKITKKMLNKTVVIQADRLSGKDLTTWVQHEANSLGLSVTQQIAEQLVTWVGDDLVRLSKELQKIALYLDHQGDLTIDVIEQLVPRTPEMDVFRLTDAYLNGHVGKTLRIYHDLLRNGEEPIMLTNLIATQIRLMIHVYALQKKGYHPQQIAKTLNVHPYRVKLVVERQTIPSMERLHNLLEKLAQIDYQLKSMSGKRERLLELFFLESIQVVNHS